MIPATMDEQRLIHFTQELVQVRSLSGEEQPAAARVAAEMQALGFDLVEIDGNGTAIGVIEGAAPGKTILLDGHTDTVGIAAGVPWNREPFGGAIIDGMLYGRGSADMKGAVAAMVHAAASLDRSQLRGRVVVSASPLEEVLEGVALADVMARYPPDCVIIGESTGLDLARGGRGRAEIHLRTIGRPAHSSSPQLGRNAVLDMMRVIDAVEQIQLDASPIMGPAILALTDIVSDPFPGHSVIPSVCRVTYDRRLLPGETAAAVLAPITAIGERLGVQLEATIGVGEYAAYTGRVFHTEKFFPAWLFAEDHWFVAQALDGLRHAGLNPGLRAYRFCTNAAYSAGIAGVPTVGFGPAEEHNAHVIDERLAIADLLAAARGYQGIVEAVLT